MPCTEPCSEVLEKHLADATDSNELSQQNAGKNRIQNISSCISYPISDYYYQELYVAHQY